MMDDLRAIDDSLVRLRLLWSAAPRQTDNVSPVEMSSVLVVEACARGADAGREVSVGDVARFADVEQSTASRLTDRAARSGSSPPRTRNCPTARRLLGQASSSVSSRRA